MEKLSEYFRRTECGGDLLGATWHQLYIYQRIRELEKAQYEEALSAPEAELVDASRG